MLLHFVLCYVVLTPIFYSPRFFLYLLPFYLGGAVALMLCLPLPGGVRAPGRGLRRLLLSLLLVGSGVRAVIEVRTLLAKAPHEVRIGGQMLRPMARAGETVMARKPHVAYFAGLEYAQVPLVDSFAELVEAGRKHGVDYLFFSPMEEQARPQFAILSDSGLRLPGLEQVAYRRLDVSRHFAIYRFTGEPIGDGGMAEALIEAIRGQIQRRPGQSWLHSNLAGHLLELGRYREALVALETAERLSPGDVMVARWQTVAHYRLEEYDLAAGACERARRLSPDTAWEPAYLGRIRLMQGRHREAAEHLRIAVAREPANPEFVLNLGLSLLEGGEPMAAAHAFDQVLRVDAKNPLARLGAARAWWRAGDAGRAMALLEASAPAERGSAAFRVLADSIRSGTRRR